MKEWYYIDNQEYIETPSLIFYPKTILKNIKEMVSMIGDVNRLRPHVKTYKTAEIVQIHLDQNIKKFKCATIAEAEMLAQVGANDVLLAYQPVGMNQVRLMELVREYPETVFSCLCDNTTTLEEINESAQKNDINVGVWIDIDNGMHRTGVATADAVPLIQDLRDLEAVTFRGLHVYDGHLRDNSLAERRKKVKKAFKQVDELISELKALDIEIPEIVAGGSPTFPVHCHNRDVQASPGTTVLWDKGYGASLEGLESFSYAALIATRVISKPGDNLICLDMGHKSISAEHQKSPLIFGLETYDLVGHSEEHMVLDVPDAQSISVGDLFYAVPHHICPTVALHEYALVCEDHQITGQWTITSRNRKLTI